MTAEDVAEDIVWAASRKEHMYVLRLVTLVESNHIESAREHGKMANGLALHAGTDSNVAETFILPVNQASPTIVHKA